MSDYSRIDLLRFHKFANENPGMTPVELLKAYDEKVPRLTDKEKTENLLKALKLSDEEIKNYTS